MAEYLPIWVFMALVVISITLYAVFGPDCEHCGSNDCHEYFNGDERICRECGTYQKLEPVMGGHTGDAMHEWVTREITT